MFTLMLPVAGRSSRFPDMRPKWLLTMPDGKLMLEKSVERLDMSVFDDIVIVCLAEHLEAYAPAEKVEASFLAATGYKARVVSLPEPTSSQSETIVKAIELANITGSFFIKDCDNMFACSPKPGNQVATVDLNEVDLIDAKNKSYIEVDSLDRITNIVEKEVISRHFCCGGYGFADAQEFLDAWKMIQSDTEVYVSHVIYQMLLNGADFFKLPAHQYVDWGTLREYRHFCKTHLTVFCDIDGVLLKNGSKFGADGWRTAPIVANLNKLKELQDQGGLYLVLTTSRPESEKAYVLEQLAEFGIDVDACLFNLPHARRILINDFSATNPYPSALAFNLERDSDSLDKYFQHAAVDI